MTWLDIVVVAIIAMSALFGIFRGFVKEMLSLVVWVLSFWVATRYSYEAAVYLESYIPYHDARVVIAFLALFCAVLITGVLINGAVVKLVRASVMSGPDRALGVIFGLLRGALIVTILIVVTAITPLAQDNAWKHSRLVGHFEMLAAWMLSELRTGIGADFPMPGIDGGTPDGRSERS